MSDHGPKLPQWWSDRIADAWLRSRAAAISDWSLRRRRSSPVDASIEEHALAFGHGARSAFPAHTTWDSLSAQLRDDWTRLGNVGAAAWDRVVYAIRHEWHRAAGPGGDAGPEPLLTHQR